MVRIFVLLAGAGDASDGGGASPVAAGEEDDTECPLGNTLLLAPFAEEEEERDENGWCWG
jgi:hypothetical protein